MIKTITVLHFDPLSDPVVCDEAAHFFGCSHFECTTCGSCGRYSCPFCDERGVEAMLRAAEEAEVLPGCETLGYCLRTAVEAAYLWEGFAL